MSKSSMLESDISSTQDPDLPTLPDYVVFNTNSSRKRRKLSESSSDEQSRVKSIDVVVKSRVGIVGHVSSAINDSAPATVDAVKNSNGKINFATLHVHPWLVASLAAMAIKRPTGIQSGCIPEILKGRDCIGGSRTGSGKTIAFLVPILQSWAEDPVGTFAVILTPTRYMLKPTFSLKFSLIYNQRTCTPNF